MSRALEQILRSAGYAARSLSEASFANSQSLDGLQLLLFVGGFDARRRETSMAVLKDALGGANLPILELVSSLDASRDGTSGVLPWPCRVGELRERIEAALLDGVSPHEREGSDG